MGVCSERAFLIKVDEGSENVPFYILVSLPPSASFLGHTFGSGEE